MRTESFERAVRLLGLVAGRVSALVVAAMLLLSAALAESAIAEPPPLWTKCFFGSAAGQCNIPRGIAASPDSGHVFIADQSNLRVVELTASGQFVKAWGWDVTANGPGNTGTGFEICISARGDICKTGLVGSGTGQFGSFGPQGVALDSASNVYVVDQTNRRVQKFDPEGNFVLMFGGDVNKTKVDESAPEAERNRCPIDPGDVCQAGTTGSGQGQFGAWKVGSFIAIDPTDQVYVGDENRIQRFSTAGVYQSEIPLPGRTVKGLTTDSAGNLYAIYSEELDVRKITPAGEELEKPRFKVSTPEAPALPTAVTVDPSGSVYVFGPTSFSGGTQLDPIWKFDSAANLIEQFGKGEFDGSTGMATNLCPGNEPPGNLYVSNFSFGGANSFVRAYGTPPTNCGKAITDPATNVEETSATLNGKANPKGLAVTECFFEYGLDDTYGQEAACEESSGEIGTGTEPVPVHADIAGLEAGTVYHFRLVVGTASGTEEGEDVTFKTKGPPVISAEHTASVANTEASVRALVNPEGLATSCHFDYGTTEAYGQSTPSQQIGEDREDHAVLATLKGLQPGTTYHWQIVCSNSSDESKGKNRSFTTFPSEPPEPDPCPNAALRSGASSFLPDCRAYEMVSPVDKNGGDITIALRTTIQVSASGEKIAYQAPPSFAGEPSNIYPNQYLAVRGDSGWFNEGIHPPVIGKLTPGIQPGFAPESMALSPDLCDFWLIEYHTPSAAVDAQPGYRNLIRRDNCEPDVGDLEALTPAPPLLSEGTPVGYVTAESVQGYSDDASHQVFIGNTAILPDCRTTSSASSISYQWLRNGVSIPGATEAIYVPTEADAGKALQCQITLINANAGSTQVGAPPVVLPPAPSPALPVAPNPIVLPAQSGPLTVGGPGGQTLTCNPGSWGGSPTFSFQWYRNGVAIAGANASTYLVSAADVATAAVFQCAVTGTNAGGAVTKVSNNRATSPAPSPAAPAPNASSGGEGSRVYDRFGGELHPVSILPDGRIDTAGAMVGSGWNGSLDNAVSPDGSHVYWTGGGGKVFVRTHPEQGKTEGECSEPSKACTVAVSTGNAYFWAAAEDGSKALYSEGTLEAGTAKLVEFTLAGGSRRTIAEGVLGVLGNSDDLSHVYFVSRKALAGAGPNSEEDVAIEGEPNLYLDEGGALSFVGTLSEKDLGGIEPGAFLEAYNLVAKLSSQRPTRVTPDGEHLAFQSRAPLTGFDNTDADGNAAMEVFTYEAGGELSCASCNPSGALPVTRNMRPPFIPGWALEDLITNVFAAAWIPGWERALYDSKVLSDTGGRLFFNSHDPLVPGDTNGEMDVYEWEAPGEGSCKESSPAFHASNDGCIYLISTGKSPFESEFWGASPDGEDVFFTTESSLVLQDPGLVDLYDARVGGGFPPPVEPVECEGEACQSPPPPPQFQTPGSSSFNGPGDLEEKAKPRKCPKGKRKVRRAGKTRCVKKRKRKAASRRRASR